MMIARWEGGVGRLDEKDEGFEKYKLVVIEYIHGDVKKEKTKTNKACRSEHP